MTPKPNVRAAPGTRDFLPSEMTFRNAIRKKIEESFMLYGFLPLETPSIERLDVLSGKYGEEADRLIFKILKRGAELETGRESGEICDLGLRYDLTVPLARVVAMNRGTMVFPFKRYQIQPVWRAERQQKGRYREFVQCDADIVGTASVSADAEIIALTDDILKRLRIPSYRIYINHRQLLQAIARTAGVDDDRFCETCIAIDKLDKIGWDGVKEELSEKGLNADVIQRLLELIRISGKPQEVIGEISGRLSASSEGEKAIAEMSQLFEDVESLGVPEERLCFSLHLARGLDYYTGPIFETLMEEPRIGSITGGGRYDKLIGVFSGETIPATGTTIGIERIFDVMRELCLFAEPSENLTKVLVAIFSPETKSYALNIASQLRDNHITTEVYFEPTKKLAKQFSYADRKKIPLVLIAGPDEISRGEVTLKKMSTGEQESIKVEELVARMKSER